MTEEPLTTVSYTAAIESRSGNQAAASGRFSVQVIWTFAARLLMTFNSVIAGIIAARWLGVEGVGQLGVITVSVAIVIQLGSGGLPSASTYFVARDKKDFFAATINSILFAIVVGSVLAALLSILARLRPAWFGFIPPDLIMIGAISIPFQLIALIGLNIFLGLGQVARFNWLDLAGQSFVLLNVIIALVLIRGGLRTYVTLNTVASVLMGCVMVLLIARYGKRLKDLNAGWRMDLQLFRRMLRYGLKFHVSIIMAALIFRADLLVVNSFRGATEAGVYSVASQIGMMLMLLPGVIATLLFPRVTEAQDPSGELAMRITRHSAFAMFFVCLAAVPLSFLLPFVYGKPFADATVQVLILLPGVYLIGLQSVLVQHFNAMGMPPAIPTFWLVTLLTNILLVFLIVPEFGARGAALASTVSYAMMFALVLIYFRRTTGQKLSRILLIDRADLQNLLHQSFLRA